MHNHPNGLPPSLDDGSSAFAHGYDQGIVVGHNLEVWTFGKTNRLYPSDFCEKVHSALDRKHQLEFSVDFNDELWYDELRKFGMEVNRRG